MTALQELQHDLKVSVSKSDYARLESHLSGWMHLNEILLMGTLGVDDLKKLILIEASTKGRRQILDKLAARLKTEELEVLRMHIAIVLRK